MALYIKFRKGYIREFATVFLSSVLLFLLQTANGTPVCKKQTTGFLRRFEQLKLDGKELSATVAELDLEVNFFEQNMSLELSTTEASVNESATFLAELEQIANKTEEAAELAEQQRTQLLVLEEQLSNLTLGLAIVESNLTDLTDLYEWIPWETLDFTKLELEEGLDNLSSNLTLSSTNLSNLTGDFNVFQGKLDAFLAAIDNLEANITVLEQQNIDLEAQTALLADATPHFSEDFALEFRTISFSADCVDSGLQNCTRCYNASLLVECFQPPATAQSFEACLDAGLPLPPSVRDSAVVWTSNTTVMYEYRQNSSCCADSFGFYSCLCQVGYSGDPCL